MCYGFLSNEITDSNSYRFVGCGVWGVGRRRMTVNAVYWGLGMEKEIKPDSSVAIIGDYKPLKAGFNYEKLDVKPRKIGYYK